MRISRRHANRRRQNGVTLVEVLIVVAIIALVSSGVAVAALKYWQGAREKTAATSARAVREAVKGWWVLHDSSTCPSMAELISTGVLDEASPTKDPWGTPWHIECSDAAVTVSSDGADRHPGTPDDIRIPPKAS